MVRNILLLITATLMLIAIAQTVGAKTITVDDDGGADYNTIQDAIDNGIPGDTIRVYEGTYYENVGIDKTLNVIGNGSSNTTIDGEYDGDVVIISGDWVNFTGFSVINCGRAKDCLRIQSDFNTVHNTTCSANVNYFPEMEAGITVESSYQNTIVNNILTNNTIGLYMRYSFSNDIKLNEFSENAVVGKSGYDIYMHGGYNNTIEENTFQKMDIYQSDRNVITRNKCTGDRITLDLSEYNNLSGNIFTNAMIELESSDKTILVNNIFTANFQRCMDLENTANLTLMGNEFRGGGITLSGWEFGDWNTHTIDSSNTVNGKEIYYLKNSSGNEIPDGKGQVIIANCTGAIVREQTYTNVSGGILVGYSSHIEIIDTICTLNYYGIFIEYSDNITITESDVSDNYYGVVMEESQDILFYKNNCSNNGNTGIKLERIVNITVSTNAFYSNIQNGIQFSGRAELSTIINNVCNNNEDGIRIDMCYNPITLINNTCNDNRYGIYIPDSRFVTLSNNTCNNNYVGIYIRDTNIANLTNITAMENSFAGIYFRDAWDCYLINSTISENFNAVLFRSGAYNISVHYNNIMGNSEFGANASENDETSNNCTHNWWGDESGPYHEDDNQGGEGDAVTDFIVFDPWLPRKVLPLTADYIVTPYFDLELEIDDTNDVIPENGIVEVFYGDRIVFQQRASDPEDDPLTFEWQFHCESSEFETIATGDIVEGMVGVDFLYEGLDGSDPILPEAIKDYSVAILVSDGVSISTKDYFIRVHPLATSEFIEQVKLDTTLLDASVVLTWRGFEEEAAPAPQYISPDKPVFVFIDDDVSPPVEDLNERGGIGLVYDIRVVGCRLQNGDEGFISADIRLPMLTSDLEYYGDAFSLQDDLRLEYYDEEMEMFQVIDDSRVIADGGVKYVEGNVDHFSIFATIVDSIYNSSHPNHNYVLPDLSVFNIGFSRFPALDGQDVEIRASIKNTGITHARNVNIQFYEGTDHLGSQIIDVVESGGGRATAIHEFIITMNDQGKQNENHDMKVFVNEFRLIEEGSQNYDNNEKQAELMVVSLLETNRLPKIISPEDSSTVNGTVAIRGDISYAETMITMVDLPFGNNDFAWHVEAVVPDSIPLRLIDYFLLDGDGKAIPGGDGSLEGIYGLNFDDSNTNITFQDNDRDGMMSAGDVFLLKNFINGGLVSEDHSLELELTGVEHVNMSMDFAEWITLAGISPWAYEWNTTSIENGEYSFRFQTFTEGIHSDTVELILHVNNIPENIPPSITITSHTNYSQVSGTITLSGSSSDEDSDGENIESVEVKIHNGSWQQAQISGYWTYEWNTKELLNGEYLIFVRSYDGEDYSPEVSIILRVENREKSDDDDLKIAGIDAVIMIPIIIASILVVVIGVIARTRSREEIKEVVPKKKLVCPNCKGPASFNKVKERWVCNRCKKYIKPLSVKPKSGIRDCPVCGDEATFSEEYDDYYCWSCERYFSDMD